MIELLIDWLNLEIKQRERAILNGMFPSFETFKVVQSEYKTLNAVLEKAEQLAAGGEDEKWTD